MDQAPPSMGFSRQEYWSGLPFPSPGDLPDPGIEPGSPALQADTLPSEPPPDNHLVVSDSLRTPWTIAHQGALSMEFPRQEYWSGLPFPSPGDLSQPRELNPGVLHGRWILYHLSHGKRESRLQCNLRVLINWLEHRKRGLDHPCGPNAITRVLGGGRQKNQRGDVRTEVTPCEKDHTHHCWL